MAFAGLKEVFNDTFKIATQNAGRKKLRSNAAINPIPNAVDIDLTDIMPYATRGLNAALRRRIMNNEALKRKFATQPKINDKGEFVKDSQGNIINEKRPIDNFDVAASLFYNRKGDFSFGRATAAGVGGYLGIAGGIRLVNG